MPFNPDRAKSAQEVLLKIKNIIYPNLPVNKLPIAS